MGVGLRTMVRWNQASFIWPRKAGVIGKPARSPITASLPQRGQTAVSREAIVDMLLKIGGENGLLMALGDDIAEADINPLIVSSQGAVAVDARFILTGAGAQA